jgi:carbon-monoxide dehydrogenase small subunit
VTDKHRVRLRVNGTEHEVLVEARRTLADMLRHDLGYTGTNVGCEHGICGACTVHLDGSPVRSCLVFGVQADGAEVRTVEGLAAGDDLTDLQQAFRDHHALQCGFCTPGFLMLAEAFLAERGLAPLSGRAGLPSGAGQPGAAGSAGGQASGAGVTGPAGAAAELTEAEIRELVASNLCRCTGYQGIVAAVLATAQARRAAGSR